MKKILATILALTMVMSLGAIAFAADATGSPIEGAPGSATADVTIDAEEPAEADTVYYVTVSYESLAFNYTSPTWGTWDGSTMKYTLADDDNGWDKTSADITVKNQSNAAVSVTASYSETNGVDGVTVAITEGNSLSLGSAAEGAELGSLASFTGEAKSGTVKVGVSGTPTEGATSQVVGTVTIAIAAA